MSSLFVFLSSYELESQLAWKIRNGSVRFIKLTQTWGLNLEFKIARKNKVQPEHPIRRSPDFFAASPAMIFNSQSFANLYTFLSTTSITRHCLIWLSSQVLIPVVSNMLATWTVNSNLVWKLIFTALFLQHILHSDESLVSYKMRVKYYPVPNLILPPNFFFFS